MVFVAQNTKGGRRKKYIDAEVKKNKQKKEKKKNKAREIEMGKQASHISLFSKGLEELNTSRRI